MAIILNLSKKVSKKVNLEESTYNKLETYFRFMLSKSSLDDVSSETFEKHFDDLIDQLVLASIDKDREFSKYLKSLDTKQE
ncbi:MAG: hypothetical protein BGO41_01265 [Clostridiales bacterium 38-18]|nr:MAG: hypothetical protein BGO41_01265 [Clostridiales bacterium 38-18]